jgi:enterochelin esterase family protein
MKINLTKLVLAIFLAALLPVSLLSCKKSDDTKKEQDDQPDSLCYKAIAKSYISSTMNNLQRPLMICLPLDYDTITSPLPVLYLFHGWDQNEFSWITAGELLTKLSTAYSAGKIDPMIVVLPFLQICTTRGNADECFGIGPEGDRFVKEMVTDVIPWVESNYNVAKDRQHRAVAGLSAGGHQTLNMGIFYPEMFDYVYPLSAGYFNGGVNTIRDGYDEVLNNPEINNIKKFTFFIGKQDEVMLVCEQTMEMLTDNGIQFNYWEADGGHDWIFWKLCIDIILPELFQEEQR